MAHNYTFKLRHTNEMAPIIRTLLTLVMLAFLHRTAGDLPRPVRLLSQEDAKWSCICEPGGHVGTQMCNSTLGSSKAFTECTCSSSCPLCSVGQVMDPRVEESNNNSCSCFSPLFVSVRLLNVHLPTYTSAMENTFISDFASLLQISPNQVFPVSRWEGGSVVLNTYIFPSLNASNQQHDLASIATKLLQCNITQNGILEDLEVGPFSILSIGNIPPTSGYISTIESKDKSGNGKILLPALMAAVALITVSSILYICLLNCRKKCFSKCSFLWFEKDVSSQEFGTTTSQTSSSFEDFQVYDNLCFNNNSGCMGKRSFKAVPKMGPIVGATVRQFFYAEMEEATHGFSKKKLIGIGGSSSVYHGRLKDGKAVAIKRLSARHGPDVNREFHLEVELLSRLHHFHLVVLVGYCIDSHGGNIERFLVYEFMPKGNLRECLDNVLGKETLNWATRVRIALGAARGLEYLHEAAEPRVLHRDFKSSNILLDEKWRAKVADFGMATTMKSSNYSCIGCPSSPAQMLGTFGYFAPEYAMMGRATAKSDVFSFGVVLLELISGRCPLDKTLQPRGQESLVVWALSGPLQDEKRVLNELADPALQRRGFPSEGMWRISQLARACLQSDPEARPSMTSVVNALVALIPHNSCSLSVPFGDQTPLYLLYGGGDCNFSRDEDRPSQSYQRGATSPPHHSAYLEIGEGTSEPKSSTHLVNEPVKRHPEEEGLDLIKPRMETFWQNNGLLAQINSPAR